MRLSKDFIVFYAFQSKISRYRSIKGAFTNLPFAYSLFDKFGTNKERASTHVGEVQLEESNDEKLLEITLDKKLSF